MGKLMKLDKEGVLIKNGTTHLYSGRAETKRAEDIEEFSGDLDSLTCKECISSGVTKLDKARIVTKSKLATLKNSKGYIARSKEHFAYPEGNGIMMCDYDPPEGGQSLEKDELLEALYEIAPVIKDVPHLWRPSASSNLFNSDTGEEIQGITGQRVYIHVENASEIPSIGRALHMLSWEHGFGYLKISRSGSLLERGLFDTSVYQPERLDYAGPPVCIKPIVQIRAPSIVRNAKHSPLRFEDLGVQL